MSKNKSKEVTITFSGEVGSGKLYALTCVADALEAKNWTVVCKPLDNPIKIIAKLRS